MCQNEQRKGRWHLFLVLCYFSGVGNNPLQNNTIVEFLKLTTGGFYDICQCATLQHQLLPATAGCRQGGTFYVLVCPLTTRVVGMWCLVSQPSWLMWWMVTQSEVMSWGNMCSGCVYSSLTTPNCSGVLEIKCHNCHSTALTEPGLMRCEMGCLYMVSVFAAILANVVDGDVQLVKC